MRPPLIKQKTDFTAVDKPAQSSNVIVSKNLDSVSPSLVPSNPAKTVSASQVSASNAITVSESLPVSETPSEEPTMPVLKAEVSPPPSQKVPATENSMENSLENSVENFPFDPTMDGAFVHRYPVHKSKLLQQGLLTMTTLILHCLCIWYQ